MLENYHRVSTESSFDSRFFNSRPLNQPEIPVELIDTLFDPRQFPCVAFTLNEDGPQVELRDFNDFPNGYDHLLQTGPTNFVQSLGINLVVAISQGQNYTESVSTLPCGILSDNFRLLVISYIYANPGAKDIRLRRGNRFVVLFVPILYFQYLPNFIKLEKDLLDIVHDIGNYPTLNRESLRSIKHDILDYLKQATLFA